MITFNHFNFNVLNLDKSLAFYKEALGLVPVREKEASENYLKTFDEIKLHFDCENDCYYKIDDHEQVKLNDHQEHCLEISNVQRDAVIKVPNTGYKEYPYLMLGMGLVMISLLGLMIYRKQGGKGNV